MEIIRAIPKDSKGNDYPDKKERNLIFFKVRYNRHRDLCEDTSLQRAVKAHYLDGKYIYAQGGLFFPEEN